MCTLLDLKDFRHLWLWFRGSAICDGPYPTPLFHGTCSDITRFRSFSHFGTLGQAKTAWAGKFQSYTSLGLPNAYTGIQIALAEPTVLRGKTLGSFHFAALRIENPIQLNDPGEPHTVQVVRDQLRAAGVLDAKTNRTIEMLLGDASESKARAIMAQIMLAHRCDGIVYINSHEQRGARSYIIIHPWQVAPYIAVASSLASHRGENEAWKAGYRALAAHWSETQVGLP